MNDDFMMLHNGSGYFRVPHLDEAGEITRAFDIVPVHILFHPQTEYYEQLLSRTACEQPCQDTRSKNDSNQEKS